MRKTRKVSIVIEPVATPVAEVVSLAPQQEALEAIMGLTLGKAEALTGTVAAGRCVVSLSEPPRRGSAKPIRYVPNSWKERYVDQRLHSFAVQPQALLGLTKESIAAAMLEQALVALATSEGRDVVSKAGHYLGSAFRKYVDTFASGLLTVEKDKKHGSVASLTAAGVEWSATLGFDASVIKFGEAIPEPSEPKARIVRSLTCQSPDCTFPLVPMGAKHAAAIDAGEELPEHHGLPMVYSERDAADAAE